MSMSIKISVYLILCFSSVKAQNDPINCNGKHFYCATENTYLLCYDDHQNGTATNTSRATLCPSGTYCENSSNDFCAIFDCDFKYFYCPSIYTYLLCDDRPNGHTGTISLEVIWCPQGTYCDHNHGDYECDSPLIPTETPDVTDISQEQQMTELCFGVGYNVYPTVDDDTGSNINPTHCEIENISRNGRNIFREIPIVAYIVDE